MTLVIYIHIDLARGKLRSVRMKIRYISFCRRCWKIYRWCKGLQGRLRGSIDGVLIRFGNYTGHKKV